MRLSILRILRNHSRRIDQRRRDQRRRMRNRVPRIEQLERRECFAGTALPTDAATLLNLSFDNSLDGYAGETPAISSGVAFEAGKVGNAARVAGNGSLQYANTGNLLATQGTIEFWIKPSWNGNSEPFPGNTFFQVGGNFNNGMLLSIDGASNLRCIQWGDDPTTGAIETGVERGVGVSGRNWRAGDWYHVAATWNGGTGHLAFYINGQSVGEITNGVRIPSFSTANFSIGADLGNHSPANAAFDEFRISNRERTTDEIAGDYAVGAGLLSWPAGIASDSSGRTIVAERTGNCVAVYSPSGSRLFSIGSRGTGNGQFITPGDVAVDGAGNILVVDTGNGRIQKFSSAGAYITQFGSAGSLPGYFNAPGGIAIDASGRIYVADTGNHRIQRFNADGSLDISWGNGGVVGVAGVVKRDHTGFDTPTDVAVNSATGEIYVSDYGNQRIEVFSASGSYARSYLAVYRANQIAFDAAGNLYISGEDPNGNYNAYDGRLRLLKAGESLITANYTGGSLDDLGRIGTGVAVRKDGTIVAADPLNGRLIATDAAFSLPAKDLSIHAKGTQVTFQWTTRTPVASVVRYGSTSALGQEVRDDTPTISHQVTVTGLSPNTTLYYAVGFADSFDGQLRLSPPDLINTGVASGDQFLRLKVAGVIYTDSDPGVGYARRTDLQQARSIYPDVAAFYWRNSGFKLWADVSIIEINKDITAGYDLFANMQSDLAMAGYSASDDFDAAWGSSILSPGNYGGGGSLFGRFVGMCEFASQDVWTLAHEGSHTLDSIYDSMGLRKYEFNHGIWAVPGGAGRDWTVNGQILRNLLPANFTAVSGPFNKVMVAPDADNDGVPDSSPVGLTNPLAITEASAGTSTTSADTDVDGLSDFGELTALPNHGTNPLSVDTDSDSVADGIDLNPAYRMNDQILRGTPVLDGAINAAENWTVLTSNWGYSNNGPSGNGTADSNANQSNTTTYAAWDDMYFYLAFKGPAVSTQVRIDGDADNWFMGPDNYELDLQSGFDGCNVQVNVGVPDLYRQIDNDGQFSEFFDTNPQFTKPYRGRTIFDHADDGLAFASRLVTESDLVYRSGGTGNNSVWEVAVPWSNVTGFHGQAGKTLALNYNVGGDLLFETDHFATVTLAEPQPAVPNVPGNLRVMSASTAQAAIAWDDLSDNESMFRVQTSSDGVHFTDMGTAEANAVAYSVSGLTPGTRYYFRVRAENGASVSEWSNVATVVTGDTPPAAPTKLRAAEVWSTQVDLKWNDKSTTESMFRVQTSSDGVHFTDMGTAAASAVTYRVLGLTPNTRYYFRVRAENGPDVSEWSNVATVVTRRTPPAAPTKLRVANVWSTQVDLKWKDNSAENKVFRMQISTDGVHFTDMGTTEANAVFFQASGLKRNTRYYFRVRAENAAGVSKWSNVIGVTTR